MAVGKGTKICGKAVKDNYIPVIISGEKLHSLLWGVVREVGVGFMMCLASNQQKMYYALQNGQVPIYQTDEDGNIIYYEDNEGNSYPLETGEYEVGYIEVVEFFSNLAMAGGETEAQEYGLSIGDYNATAICSKNAHPIVEGSLIWHKSKVGYKDTEETIIDGNSADYRVVKVSESLNFVKYVLKAIIK